MKRRETGSKREIGRRILIAIVAVSVFIFAVQGGEYSTSDLVHQWTTRKRLVVAIDSLQREVDSLARRKHAILTDPTVQERIAREEFGMVRGDKELLYRFADQAADTSRR
ncbi:MAG TPA: hypothetical protein VFW98_16095 [Gemmatimonadaceae bacterium]|nr:hypothetical protein [Gemmatimonadaceae bacterium]